MDVSVTPEMESFVSAAVQSGRFRSASEVVQEALRLLEEYERERATRRTVFNEELGRRLASLERGENVDPREAISRLRQKSEERRKGA
jgi:antitoxin ParD1/3/4